MSPYTALHLALAATSAALALVHTASWLAVRSQRAQIWVAASFFGFSLMALGNAFSSSAANPVGDRPVGWILLASSMAVPLPWALFQTSWAVLHQPVNAQRRTLAIAAVVLGGIRALELCVLALRWPADAGPLRLEAVTHDLHTLTGVPFWALTLMVALAWWVEALLLIRKRGALAWVAVGTAPLAAAVICWDIGIALEVYPGPSLLAVIGFPFLLMASTSLAVTNARALCAADLGSGVHRYQKLVRIGRGGMGEVWLALRTGEAGFQRYVVLKRMARSGQDVHPILLRRFHAEARTAARLRHPNILGVHDLGQIDGAWMIVMEYLEGPSLLEVLRACQREKRPVPVAGVAAIGIQICRGLAHAHERGVLHRDISPDNVVVTFDGMVKLVDFGLAAERAERGELGGASANAEETGPGGERLTQTGRVLGKPSYLPPERREGGEHSASADLYAVAIVLCELLAGAPIRDGVPLGDPLSSAEIPESMRRALRTALEPDPQRRLSSAEALRSALQQTSRELPPFEVSTWLKELLPSRWWREQRLSALVDPSPEQVEEILASSSDARSHGPLAQQAV